MIEKLGKIENARWVEGDLGLHFVYTAGVAGEEFLKALAKGKILAGTCDRCSRTYCPPRMFCETCLAGITDRHDVPGTGAVETLTRLEVDVDGNPSDPQWVGAVRLDGTDSTMVHRLHGDGLSVGSRVVPVWSAKRTGSILDIEAFRSADEASVKARPSVARTVTANGPTKTRRGALAE